MRTSISVFFVALVGLLLAFSAPHFLASAAEPNTVTLSGPEVKQAQQIAEQRQQLVFEFTQAQNEFQAKLNRLHERQAGLDAESEKLCFALKKAHSLPPDTKYWLDEWRGELKKRSVTPSPQTQNQQQ